MKSRGLDESLLGKIYIARTINSDHQINLVRYEVPEIARKNPLKLLVVDSIMAHFSAEYIGRGQLAERQQTLNLHIYDILHIQQAKLMIHNYIYLILVYFLEKIYEEN